MNVLSQVWRTFTRIIWVIGGLLTFLVLFELFRIFIFLHEFNPAWAWGYVAVLSLALLGGLFYALRQSQRYPKPLIPPTLPPLAEATHGEMKRYATYLIRYQRRLARNRNIHSDVRSKLNEEVEAMDALLNHHPLNEDLKLIIEKSEREILPLAQVQLKSKAEREIRRSVRDVMLGVTLSPYHSIDLLIVLYRNFSMIFRIMKVYETSPVVRAQWRIVRDVMRVMATVNFLYVGRNLIENLFAFVPWVGRVADDIGQGLGAGLFTSACGHAVIDRCSSYHEWEKAAAVESLASQSKGFIRDVKNIFTKDVLPDIKNRIISEAPSEAAEQPGFWDNLQTGVNKAFDATLKSLGSVWPNTDLPPVAEPDYAQPATTEGASPVNGSVRELSARRRAEASRSRSAYKGQPRRGIRRVMRTFGQRIKYSVGLGRED